MGLIYALIVLSFFALIVINLGWALTNLYFFIVEGVQTLMVGSTFAENIYFSTYLKWILLLDAIWISSTLIFIFRRTFYKTDPKLHYLSSNLISEPEIFVIIPTYNEEQIVEKVINDYKNQKFVKTILVVDNHSSDKTVEIARSCGAKVIEKEQNKGFAHSCVVGMKESLKSNADIIDFSEREGTISIDD